MGTTLVEEAWTESLRPALSYIIPIYFASQKDILTTRLSPMRHVHRGSLLVYSPGAENRVQAGCRRDT